MSGRWPVNRVVSLVVSSCYSPALNCNLTDRWEPARGTQEGVNILGSSVFGALVPPEYWLSDAASASLGDFLFAQIPADAVPETVLSQLAKLA